MQEQPSGTSSSNTNTNTVRTKDWGPPPKGWAPAARLSEASEAGSRLRRDYFFASFAIAATSLAICVLVAAIERVIEAMIALTDTMSD